MKHIKLFEEFVGEKVYQLTGIYGAKGIVGKLLFAFKKEIERIKYEGDSDKTLEEVNKIWSKWSKKEGVEIIKNEVLKHIKDEESIVYIMASLDKTWEMDTINNINAPGKTEALIRIPSDFVINIGFADDVNGNKFTRKLDGMLNIALISGTEIEVMGSYNRDVMGNNVEIRSSMFLTIDAK